MALAPAFCASPSERLVSPKYLIWTPCLRSRARLHTAGVSVSVRRCPSVYRVRASTEALDEPEQDSLAAEFMRHVNASKQTWPHEKKRPTALMPPNTVVEVQMDSLMRNDWPEEDSGVRTAFHFSMPAKVDEILGGQVPESVYAARAWSATERYLSFPEFSALLRDPMYAPLINCLDWKIASPVVFHGPGDSRALQCVTVSFESQKGATTYRAYTFCLQKVKQGAYRDCWMVVGVRLGDYANV